VSNDFRRAGFEAELRELQTIVADYKAMRRERDAELRRWRKARRELIDICLAHCDVATLEAILAHLEKACCAWDRWPASHK
jgi:hypothetical protein